MNGASDHRLSEHSGTSLGSWSATCQNQADASVVESGLDRRRACWWEQGHLTGCGGASHAAIRTTGSGPTRAYDCTFNVDTTAWTGAYGTASEIGWEGNHQGVVTCLGGTFHVQNGINRNFGFGIYTGTPTTWTDADGYLPAQVTTFRHSGADRLHHRVR